MGNRSHSFANIAHGYGKESNWFRVRYHLGFSFLLCDNKHYIIGLFDVNNLLFD